jgi:hypothetical protein
MVDIGQIPNHLIHILGIGPLFLYVGLGRDTVPDFVFNILGIMAIVILAYHSYRAYLKIKDGKSAWVNWIHIFAIAPLLLMLAYLKKDASRRYFEMMLLLGFSAMGYHTLYLIRESLFA